MLVIARGDPLINGVYLVAWVVPALFHMVVAINGTVKTGGEVNLTIDELPGVGTEPML
jgi:hypothetical protein